ncbi:MAG: hypothetical protein AB2392_18040 [Neobacillus sp.]
MDLDLFRQWLLDNKGLMKKSAGDVVSRVKRVNKLIHLEPHTSYEGIVMILEKNEEFSKLSTFVKPQLKHSIRMYKEFIQESK